MKQNNYGFAHGADAVGEVVSRTNHSCDPNCFMLDSSVPGRGFSMGLMATRRIMPGEELGVSYIPEIHLPKAQRLTVPTLHPAPYTPHPTPYTLHPTPYTLHP